VSRRPRRKRAPLGPRYVGSIGGPDLRGDLYDIGSKADMAAAVLETHDPHISTRARSGACTRGSPVSSGGSDAEKARAWGQP